MTVNELKIMVDMAIAFGQEDAEIVVDEGRDGSSYLKPVKVEPLMVETTGSNEKKYFLLVKRDYS